MTARHTRIGTQEIRTGPPCSSPASRSDVQFRSCFAPAGARICDLGRARARMLLQARPLLRVQWSRLKREYLALLPRSPCHGAPLAVTGSGPGAKR